MVIFGIFTGLARAFVEVVAQQFNQAQVVAHTRFGAVGKERQAQTINCQMSFNAVDAFVMTEPFGLDTSITGILHCLQVDN